MINIDTMKLALDALDELNYSSGTVVAARKYESAIAALRQAISEAEQAEQEPVALNIATQCRATASSYIAYNILVDGGSGTLRELLLDAANALENTAPPQKTWVSLTVEQFCQMEFEQVVITEYADGTKTIKAKLKEKNHD